MKLLRWIAEHIRTFFSKKPSSFFHENWDVSEEELRKIEQMIEEKQKELSREQS